MAHVRRKIAFACCFGATVLLAACSGDVTAPVQPPDTTRLIRVNECVGPATSLSPAIAATFTHDARYRTIDDMWADLARTAPGGFAGILYTAPTDVPTILLTDTTKAAAAKDAIAAFLVANNVSLDVRNANVAPARWDAAQLLDWYYYLLSQPIWTDNNVTASDIDDVANRIRISTADSTSQTAFAQKMETLNLPCDLLVVGIQEPVALEALTH
jgi:hypothetical protein